MSYDKNYLTLAAKDVKARLPDNHGFILLTMSYGEDGRLNYVSTISREDAINVLKEFLIKCGAAEDWMQHIK